jgi:hypothetical protein
LLSDLAQLADKIDLAGLFMQTLKAACREAAWVFVLSRLVIVIISSIAFFTIAGVAHSLGPACPSPVCIYFHWDFPGYVQVAYQGFQVTRDVVYFPLWPLLIGLGGRALGGAYPFAYYMAAMLLANICFYLVLVLLYSLLLNDFEESLARRALFYLAFAPDALFFFIGYPESLFLLLCVAVFLLLRRGKWLDWWAAGVLGMLASLTRSTGIVLVVPFLAVYVQRFWMAEGRDRQSWGQKLNAFIPVFLIPAGTAIYMLYLWHVKGNPFLVTSQEADIWHRHFALPWVGFTSTIQLLFSHTLTPLTMSKNVIDLVLTLAFLITLALGWRRLPLHYSLFALAMALFVLCVPESIFEPLASMPRFFMVIFPITVIFASWGKQSRFDQFYLALALPLFAMNVILFISHMWVA